VLATRGWLGRLDAKNNWQGAN
jgi:hypothetical protein